MFGIDEIYFLYFFNRKFHTNIVHNILYVVICIKFLKERMGQRAVFLLNWITKLEIFILISWSVFTIAALPLLFEQGNTIRPCASLSVKTSYSDESLWSPESTCLPGAANWSVLAFVNVRGFYALLLMHNSIWRIQQLEHLTKNRCTVMHFAMILPPAQCCFISFPIAKKRVCMLYTWLSYSTWPWVVVWVNINH